MITNQDMDLTFQALANETRREILDLLRDQPGLSVGKLAANFDVSRIAVMNHLSVLEKAGLVVSQKDGRARCLYLNIVPIQLIYERWTDEYQSYWGSKLTKLKYAAEQAAHKNEESGS